MLKWVSLARLKSDVHKLDIEKPKTGPDNLNIIWSKVDKIDIVRFKTIPVDLKKLGNIADVKSSAWSSSDKGYWHRG